MNLIPQFRKATALVLAASIVSHAQSNQGTPPSPSDPSSRVEDKSKATGKKRTAEQPATTGAMANVVTGPPPSGSKPWTGSFVTYGHHVSAVSLNKGAEPDYNPTYFHQLDLRPQWNLGTMFFLRGRLALTQELTLSDETTYRNEVVLSDTWVDLGWRGTKIPVIDTIVTAGLRTVIPTSKTSNAETLVMGLSPAVLFIKNFPLWGGLTLLADARFSQFFHRFTTSQRNTPAIDTCGDINSLTCNNYVQMGTRNASNALGYGGGFSLNANDRLSFTSQFRMSHSWLYPLSSTSRPTESGDIDLPKDAGTQMRHLWIFFFDVNYQITPAFAVSAGTWTFSPQLNPDSTYRNPFFNRLTMLHVDLGINIDALIPKS